MHPRLNGVSNSILRKIGTEWASSALTEQGACIVNASDYLPNTVLANAAKNHDEDRLAALIGLIAGISTDNRMNVLYQGPAGDNQPDKFD
jgi:hypothetical protein